ncbi:unnamed protein product [Blepharisma stoltei]|uniref:Cyclic nucleotide-binding domain-containing protein n=1 Tax=Blepharisma stoltei TaxID=1481888 RepID=A0AAU9IIC1_9CILI|nr:unnamed protein product [Blepharisma stoltei]
MSLLTQKTRKNIPQNVFEILQRSDRSTTDIERLLEYFKTIEDLANYTAELSKRSLSQLAANFYIEEYEAGQEVFQKGAKSDKLYIVLRGHLSMIDRSSDGTEKLIATLPKGKMIGERGLIRDQPRQLSAVAKDYVVLLALNGDKFKSLMMNNISAELNEKVSFFNTYIPDFKIYSNSIREKIAYAFEFIEVHKKDIVVEEGSFSEALYYIVEGECVLSKGVPPKKRNIMTVGRGCSIADECVLLGKRAEFTASVWTDTVKFYKAKRADLLPLIPEEIMFKLVGLSRAKFISRNNVNERATAQTKTRLGKSTNNFPLASQRAQKLITQTLNRNSSTHIIASPSNESPKNCKYKLTLEKLRDITIERFYKFNANSGSLSDKTRGQTRGHARISSRSSL